MTLPPRTRTVLAWALWLATMGCCAAGLVTAAAALTWSLVIPLGPWLDQLVRDRRPLPLAAQLTALGELTVWAPAIALGITLPALLVPDGRLRSRRWWWVAAAAVAGSTMFVVGVLLIPGPPATPRSRSTTRSGSRAWPARWPRAWRPPAWPCTSPPCRPPCSA